MAIYTHGANVCLRRLTCHGVLRQVGQVILTLPYTMAQTGMVLGILLQLGYAVMASWTAYLMNTLYMEHVNRKERLKALSQYPAHPNERSASAGQKHRVLCIFCAVPDDAHSRLSRQLLAVRSLAMLQRCGTLVPVTLLT